ncbi:hypothetical protein HI914_01216 [Erysiphe necator]|nr:hypothetical protein HI914_01216 [Erysiphe necator]
MDGNDDLEKLIALIPKSYLTTPQLPCHCCCKSSDCTFLKDICAAFEQLENELQAAAHLGQALLVRHKKCVNGAERERSKMCHKYTQLENEKKTLDEENEKTQETNRWLFEQLEDLNQSVGQSETYIKALEATLDSTRYEFKRLQTLAARTQDLENQLAILEREQEKLQNNFWTSQELKRKAVKKWKTAERVLVNLQDQMAAIDRETKEERVRHAELIAQMKRQRVVERELNAIAVHSKCEKFSHDTKNLNGKNFPSFVRDILQENASLHSAILEFRDLLICSNEETQMLREQLTEQQALGIHRSGNQAPTLKAELINKDNPITGMISSSFHIHHHYHTQSKGHEFHKVKRKSKLVDQTQLTPLSLPKYRHRRRMTDFSTTSQKSGSGVSEPKTPCRNRWSEQASQLSEIVSSSVPNSPQSYFKNNNVFDGLSDFGSSSPTSPGSSIDHFSPGFDPYNKSKLDVLGRSNLQACENLKQEMISEEKSHHEYSDLSTHDILSEHVSASWEPLCLQGSECFLPHKPTISTSKFDTPALKNRPSQISLSLSIASLQLRQKSRLHPPSTLSLRENITASSSAIMAQPILTTYEYGQQSTSKLLSNMLANDNKFHKSSRLLINNTTSTKISRWLKAVSILKRSGNSLKRKKNPRILKFAAPFGSLNKSHVFSSRPPGINQKGSVPGFSNKEYKPLPCQISPIDVNYDALHDVLAEDLNAMTLK